MIQVNPLPRIVDSRGLLCIDMENCCYRMEWVLQWGPWPSRNSISWGLDRNTSSQLTQAPEPETQGGAQPLHLSHPCGWWCCTWKRIISALTQDPRPTYSSRPHISLNLTSHLICQAGGKIIKYFKKQNLATKFVLLQTPNFRSSSYPFLKGIFLKKYKVDLSLRPQARVTALLRCLQPKPSINNLASGYNVKPTRVALAIKYSTTSMALNIWCVILHKQILLWWNLNLWNLNKMVLVLNPKRKRKAFGFLFFLFWNPGAH